MDGGVVTRTNSHHGRGSTQYTHPVPIGAGVVETPPIRVQKHYQGGSAPIGDGREIGSKDAKSEAFGNIKVELY